jgi:hypothetical protein
VPLDPRLERAITRHVGMAESIAWRYIKRLPAVDGDEIRSVALEALVSAGHKWIGYCEARSFSPWSVEDDGLPEGHFGAYISRTVNGRILDWCRHQDHLTRSARHKVKAIQQAQDDGVRGEAGLAAAAGLSVERARQVLAADAARPVSLEWHNDIGEYAGAALADDGASTESQAVVSGILAGFLAGFDSLPAVQQVLIAFVFHQELELDVAAKEVFLEPDEARRQLEQAVCSIHNVLLMSVSSEGAGVRLELCAGFPEAARG